MLVTVLKSTSQQIQVLQSFSLLFLGATLSTWATINFSLALLVGLLASPLSFARPISLPSSGGNGVKSISVLEFCSSIPLALLYLILSPPLAIIAVTRYSESSLGSVLLEIAKGWSAQGVWSYLVIWGVWWPAWIIGGIVLFSGLAKTLR